MNMTNATESRTQYLSFALSGEEYSVNILRVKEIIEYDELTRVPGMPPCVRGVINLRGRVVPVVDLASRFGLADTVPTRRSCIVMVEVQAEDSGGAERADGEGSIVVGIITDAVSQVLDVVEGSVEPPPTFGTPIGADFLEGMVEGGSGRKFVMILNIDRALAAKEFAVAPGAAEAGLPGLPDAVAAGTECAA